MCQKGPAVNKTEPVKYFSEKKSFFLTAKVQFATLPVIYFTGDCFGNTTSDSRAIVTPCLSAGTAGRRQ
jgi:hypothetical protein